MGELAAWTSRQSGDRRRESRGANQRYTKNRNRDFEWKNLGPRESAVCREKRSGIPSRNRELKFADAVRIDTRSRVALFFAVGGGIVAEIHDCWLFLKGDLACDANPPAQRASPKT